MKDYRTNTGISSKQVLDECRNLMNARLSRSLSTMMDKVDDMLFDLSSQTNEINMRTQYFYAMREMRLKRQEIKSNFQEKFNKLFERGLLGELDIEDIQFKSREIEESVALENTITKANNDCREALLYLDKRMGDLLNDPGLQKVTNSLRPEVVCSAFQEACESIDSDIEIKLILFKLFDKYVTSGLQDIYIEINNLFLDNQEETSVTDNPDIKAADINDRAFYLKANLLIKDTIDHCDGVDGLPEFVRIFLYHYWSKLLLKIYIRDGADGSAWLHAIDVVNDMVNVVGSETSLKEKQNLAGLLPNLKQRLRYGMNVIPVAPVVRDEFLNELTQYFKSILQTPFVEDNYDEENDTEDVTVPKIAISKNDVPFMSELLMDEDENDTNNQD